MDKTIEGLEKVDVILRRMDDVYCDPLELKPTRCWSARRWCRWCVKGHGHCKSVGKQRGGKCRAGAFLPAVAKHFCTDLLCLPLPPGGAGTKRNAVCDWQYPQPGGNQHFPATSAGRSYRRCIAFTAGTGKTGCGYQGKSLLIWDGKINFASALYEKRVPSGLSFIDQGIFGEVIITVIWPCRADLPAAVPPKAVLLSQPGRRYQQRYLGAGCRWWTWAICKTAVKTDDIPAIAHKRALPSNTAENLFWVGRYTERLLQCRLQRTVMQYVLQHNVSEDTDIIRSRKILRHLHTAPGPFLVLSRRMRTAVYSRILARADGHFVQR